MGFNGKKLSTTLEIKNNFEAKGIYEYKNSLIKSDKIWIAQLQSNLI